MPEIAASLVIGAELPGGDYYMPLFVVLAAGAQLSEELRKRIRRAIREQVSPRHVPDDIVAVPAVPTTLTGKKLEVPIKRLIQGVPPETAVNRATVANPEVLSWYADFATVVLKHWETSMSYTPPSNVDTRPVAVIGGGTLGRRIAAMFAAGGADVRIFDLSAAQRAAAVVYATEQAPGIRDRLGLTAPHTGTVEATADLPGAVERAWMVVEAVPEKRDLKTDVLGTLDRLAAADAILASNSSSFATSELIDKVEHVERVLNTHYQMPPDLNAVELMSDGHTDENIILALMAKLPQYGLVPFHVRRQSDGFILNRVWAAIKRECLMVVAEGVA